MPREQATILHVDIDAFFASVEQLLDPSLRGRPVIVGGLGGRGVVSAASYEARRFGVHSAMPMSRALRACPDGVFLSPRFDEYTRFSRAVMNLLQSLTPLVEPLSIDEAFLDVAGARRLHGTAADIAVMLRKRVREEIGLTVSVGIATTKFLAKIASDMAKPDGMLLVEAGSELEFLHPLPVDRLWGVGPATVTKLDRVGIRTVGELAEVPLEALVAMLGKAAGSHLHSLAMNLDDRSVETEREVKSIGAEETFGTDLTDGKELDRELLRLVDKVASRVRAAGLSARTVTLKVRFGDFETITRSSTLDDPAQTSAAFVRAARGLLASAPLARGVRLLGVHASNLGTPGPVQAVLDLGGVVEIEAERSRREAAVGRAVDEVRSRFGAGSVGPATLVPRAAARDGDEPHPEPA